MKKHFLLLLALSTAFFAGAQSRGIKIAYIDMEYILEKVPDYAEAKNQLEMKAQKWKQEIEAKKNDINKLKENLKTERVLLTKELITEREEEITFLENELLDYQEKRFGPKGDLISQKSVLVKPIQDQVFTAVQDISEAKKYDFVFDKSSHLTMLFAAQRHDISDQVIRRITRSSKREQLTGKELKKLDAVEAAEDLADDPDFIDKKKAQEEKKAARQKLIDDRKATQEARRADAVAKREQEKLDREAKRTGAKTKQPAATPAQGTIPATQNTSDLESEDEVPQNANRPGAAPGKGNNPMNNPDPVQGENAKEVKTTATETPEDGSAAPSQQSAAEEQRKQKQEDRKRAIEERKQKILADREAAKKAREDKNKKPAEEENKNEN